MNAGSIKGRRNFAAIYLPFFTIGLLNASFPLLNRNIISFVHDEYGGRILSFAGLLLLSILCLLFSRIRPGKDLNMWIALSVLVTGMIFPLLNPKSAGFLFLSSYLLLAGSLFVQVSGLLLLVRTFQHQPEPGKIALLYLFNSTGLIAGMSVSLFTTASGIARSLLPVCIPLGLLTLSMICLHFFPGPGYDELPQDENKKFNLHHLISNKTMILMMGGLAVYAGAEYCLMEMLPYYFSETYGIRITQMIIPGVGLFILSFFTGRIAGVMLLRIIRTDMVFLFSGLLAVFGISSLYIGQKDVAVAATILVGLGTANILPVLISLAMERISEDRKWIVGMIAGSLPLGAFLPTLMWAMADSISIGMSITIPVVCLFYVTWIAIVLIRKI